MMDIIWLVLFVALTGSHFGDGLPLRSTPQTYPHDSHGQTYFEGWGPEHGVYAAVPALLIVLTAVGLLFGCTWCYRHKDCKLFTASAVHLHDTRRNHPPDSGFSEPINNNISEDNNNGPISLREMQNIANNNAAAYIVSENEERNRVSRESVVEFEPLPNDIRVVDPLEHCADWFGDEDLPRSRLQYLREIGRGWFGRVVEGELEENGETSTVAVKILNQNASLEDKARFLDEARMYRNVNHENVLRYIAKCLQEDPWILIFELCSMDLQQYLVANRPKMAILNERGVPLQLMCDVTSALAHLHSTAHLYGNVWSGAVLVRGEAESARAVLGQYTASEPSTSDTAPETTRHPIVYTSESEVWSLGNVLWEVCSWGSTPTQRPPPPPELPCVYRNHLYQVMQLCWHPNPECRPSASQVYALINHLYTTHVHSSTHHDEHSTAHFEERWQTLKPNTIPKIDEHVAIVHAPSTSVASHFTGSDHEFDKSVQDTLSVDMDTAVSRSSSIMSDRDPLSIIKSESLTNLHGSLEDVRNIYLTHNETAVLECHQANIIDDKDNDRSDSSVDPWLKDIIAGSQDDVSYYKDVSDVIKNLDNILNSEKTSSSESSHQASPSRDNLSLDCKKDYPMQSNLVKSPGISNFQNILEIGFSKPEENEFYEEDVDRDTIGTLSHSFERHSDTNSQHTLENLTPDTPMKEDIAYDVESPVPVELTNCETVDIADDVSSQTTELPKETVESNVSKLPMLKELCLASIPSLSEVNIELNVREDCQTPCDNLTIRTDIVEIESKSVNDTVLEPISSTIEEVIETNMSQQLEQKETIEKRNAEEVILPKLIEETIEKHEVIEVSNNAPHTQEHQTVMIEKIKDIRNETLFKSDDTATDAKNGVIQSSDLILPDKDINNSSKLPENCVIVQEVVNKYDLPEEMENSVSINTQAPESVQNVIEKKSVGTSNYVEVEPEFKSINISEETIAPVLPPDTVQNITEFHTANSLDNFENKDSCTNSKCPEKNDEETLKEQLMDSTAYIDLVKSNSECVSGLNGNDGNVKDVFKTCLASSDTSDCFFVDNESTVYLDPPSVIKTLEDFLNSERAFVSRDDFRNEIHTSTPKSNESVNTYETSSTTIVDNSGNTPTVTTKAGPSDVSQIKVPDYGPGVTLTMLEQKYVPENLSPFESPTKSHHTDTYDENSSVVLGPFENCTLELFKGVKSELVDFPKEELLAFSANFSEINLETPSPLRDGNFLNEVPDIVHEELHFDDIITSSETNPEVKSQSNTDDTDKSSTEKRVSPSTPPNSPGIFLASTSQPMYLIDIDLNPPNEIVNQSHSADTLQRQIDLHHLAMAENENNMNLEYSRPLTVEGLVSEDSETVPESFLAGNGGSIEELRERFTLDEVCVEALRNELELKLPLAQVAAIEPQCETDHWSVELPPPPELVVSYPGALSPIAEETGQQLSAYENDVNWSTSIRTESSESYPEPCNSSDEVTDLLTAVHSRQHSTYTIHDPHKLTYTVQLDTTSREITMSDDSLNPTPRRKTVDTSPVEERTLFKHDADTCERISQVSPFMLSPTADTSDVTGVSTLSKTTVPTDAKPSETQCLSKATSIDSWCSNDTLYNVEENFDDLAMDPDLPDFETEKEDNSESSHTLTHNDDEKELSHCSTYIIHDSKSEPCDTFSADSITAHDNDNNTYTKVKTEATGSPTGAKSEANDSTKNTQTKDLAYGTLMSGLPSYSNCTTETLTAGMDDGWNLPQPELVRRSPLTEEINVTPPKLAEKQDSIESSPQITSEPRSKKLDSVDVTCLNNNLLEDVKSETHESVPVSTIKIDSPVYYINMAQSVTSTPMTQQCDDKGDLDITPIHMPQENEQSSEDNMFSLPNLQSFMQSAELREQEVLSNAAIDCCTTYPDSGVLLGESKTFSKNSDKNVCSISERSSAYENVEIDASNRSGEMHSKEKSSQNLGATMNSEEFLQFENSVKNCPQDLSSLNEANAMLLSNERRSNELCLGSTNNELIADQSCSQVEPIQGIVNSPPNDTNLKESQVANAQECNIFLNDFYEEEIKQPLSIIITENLMDEVSENPNNTYVDHIENIDLNSSFNVHNKNKEEHESLVTEQPTLNGINLEANEISEGHSLIIGISAEIGDNHEPMSIITNSNSEIIQPQDLPNGSYVANLKCGEEIKCNGDLEKYATVNFLNETFEELIESNVDDSENKDQTSHENENSASTEALTKEVGTPIHDVSQASQEKQSNGTGVDTNMTSLMKDFLQNEKKFCELDSYLPLLNDIRFSGPAAEIMSTSFSQESPTVATAPECERDVKPNAVADILKEWDSDSESQSSNSSGEFIWKGEQRTNHGDGDGGGSAGSGDSGSEGDEVEFVPSSWDCCAAPAKSSMRSLEQTTPDNKKRVVFKRQKYHCVYEYPREAPELDADSPANYVPDLSTYSEWDSASAEDAELGYGQLFCAPSPLDVYTLRAGIAFGADYDEDFFISSSARPFESLGVMTTTSQFFPGMHVKPSLLDRDIADDITDDFPPPPSPSPTPTIVQTRTPSLDFTTPDSGVEDITPGSTSTEEDYKTKKLPEADLTQCWKSIDSASSSESVSPSSPGGETLGGLRHTRDKLKLDLPPSPHISSPRHNRVFNFVLEKPKRNRPVQEDTQERPEIVTTPLVMTDETPVITTSLPLQKETEDVPLPEPTFSTFGKSAQKIEPEQKIILTDDIQEETDVKEESNHVKETVKGEGTVLDSGDEDSGIESSSKATLERKTPNVS